MKPSIDNPIEVNTPTRKTQLHSCSYEAFILEVVKKIGSFPAKMQAIGLDNWRPGFLVLAHPNIRKQEILGWSFSINDLSDSDRKLFDL